jgi:hypothetical protein
LHLRVAIRCIQRLSESLSGAGRKTEKMRYKNESVDGNVASEAATSGLKTSKKANTSSGRKHERRDQAIRLMCQPAGITYVELAKKMDWELHTTRSFVSVLRSKYGFNIESFVNEAGQRTYRIKWSEHVALHFVRRVIR